MTSGLVVIGHPPQEEERAEFSRRLQQQVLDRENALLNSERAYRSEREQLENGLIRDLAIARYGGYLDSRATVR